MERTVDLAGRRVGLGQPPLFIAEIGANHNGDMELCRRLIDAAATAGADAVKFQSWSESSLLAACEYDQRDSFRQEVRRYQLTPKQHRAAQEHCAARGVLFCSTPFSMPEADMLEELNVPFFKIASSDINHVPLLRHVARKARPLILSTGMATVAEIDRAIEVIRSEGNERIVLLHCVSLYPPNWEAMNLRNIPMLSEVFGVPVGFSDHTVGVACPLAAIALSACVIEKHFTLDKTMEGWDHAISADPPEMAMIVREGRHVWQSLGRTRRSLSQQELEKKPVFRRSVVAKHAMKAGHVVTERDLDFKRPGTGIRPDEVAYVLGHVLAEDVAADQVLRWSHLLKIE